MRKYAMSLRFIGASLLALAIATPALAQDKATEGPSVLDELVPEGSPDAAVPPAPTGDPVLDRLNALEFKVRALETRNVELETALDTANGRVATVTSKVNKCLASNGIVPTFSDPSGTTTFTEIGRASFRGGGG